MTVRRLFAFALLASLPLACGAARPEIATMPPDVRAQWDRCEQPIDRWCIDHSHGSPSHERACMQEESGRFAALPDDAARASYLASHGCRL